MKNITGKQSKLDLNKNGKLDSNDFKMLRSKKGNGGGTGVSSETGYAVGTNSDLIMNQDYLAYANGGGVGNDWFNKGVGTNGLNKIKEHSKQNPKILFLVTDDNYSNIGSYYLLDGKFAKKTVANASYDLQKSKVNLKPKSDVIYKMKQLGDPNGYYEKGGSLADTPESFPSTDAMSYGDGGATSTWSYSIGGL